MDPAYRAAHIKEDRAHWWFRGRLRVLLAVLRAELPRRPLRLLELGCGTGNVLWALTEFGEVVGMEPDERLIAAAHAEGLDVRRGAMPADLVVPDGWADVVLLLDVLEHLDDEAGALATARRAGRHRAGLRVAVERTRSSARPQATLPGGEIRRVVERAGFRVTYTSYFNTVLFPGLALVRLLKRARGSTQHDLGRAPTAVNGLLEWCFAIERHLVPRVALPFGFSVLLLARRS